MMLIYRCSQKPTDLALKKVFDMCVDLKLVDRIQLLYDIWCRYGVHLKERYQRNFKMSFPAFAEVMGSVGVWHIYGHVFECFGRYSNLYSRHTGIIDGEILESLWSILNEILESCRGMSLAHREEVISLFQSHSNLRKTLDMGMQGLPLRLPCLTVRYSYNAGEEVRQVHRRAQGASEAAGQAIGVRNPGEPEGMGK